MNICWDTLSSDIIKEPLKLKVNSDLAKHMVSNFTHSKFSKKDLSEDSYYTKAGYGQPTVDAINKECRAKFPKKTFADLKLKLQDDDIISYAYFVKEVQYLHPFALNPKFYFNGKMVQGFKAKDSIHYDNIRICHYTNNDEFILKLLLKQKDEELFIIKGSQQALTQDIVSKVEQHSDGQEKPKHNEKF